MKDPNKALKQVADTIGPDGVAALKASSFNSDLLCAEVGVLISQFLLYMQLQSIAPCYLFIGDSAQRLTEGEMVELKNAFIEQLLNT